MLRPTDLLELSINYWIDDDFKIPLFTIVGWLLFTLTIVVTITTQIFAFLAGFLLYRLIDWTALIVIGHDVGLADLSDALY